MDIMESSASTSRMVVEQSQRCKNTMFLLTCKVDDYAEVRQDMYSYLELLDLSSYVIALERGSKEDNPHLHCFFETTTRFSLWQVNNYVRIFKDVFDLQAVRRKNDVLKYITKQDVSPMYNVQLASLHFNFRARKWAENALVFKFTDPFVLEHRFCYKFLQSLHAEVHNTMSAQLYEYNFNVLYYHGWALSVATWLREFTSFKQERKVPDYLKTYKRKQMYIHGPPDVGKSTFVSYLLKDVPNTRIFRPDFGQFGFQDIDVALHHVIVIEECDFNKWPRPLMLTLLEGRPTVVPVKCKLGKTITFTGPILCISNLAVPADAAYESRLLLVEANTPYWEEARCFLPKAETLQQQVIDVSSDDDD